MGLPPGDYRPQSYLKRAAETARAGGYGGGSGSTPLYRYVAPDGKVYILPSGAKVPTPEGYVPVNQLGTLVQGPAQQTAPPPELPSSLPKIPVSAGVGLKATGQEPGRMSYDKSAVVLVPYSRQFQRPVPMPPVQQGYVFRTSSGYFSSAAPPNPFSTPEAYRQPVSEFPEAAPQPGLLKKIGFGYVALERRVSDFIFPLKTQGAYGERIFNPGGSVESFGNFMKRMGSPAFREFDWAKMQERASESRFFKMIPGGERFAAGARMEVMERPVTTAAFYAATAGAGYAFNVGKLGLVKLAGKLPKGGALAMKGIKYGSAASGYGLLAAYGGTAAYNVAVSPEGPAYALGQESIRGFAIFKGAKLGTRLSARATYRTGFEEALQTLPQPRQARVRAEFAALKGELSVVGRGRVTPSRIAFGEVEALQDPRAAKIVRSFLLARKDIAVIGGSLSSRVQVPRAGRGYLRMPGDIDVYTDIPGLGKQLGAELRAGGISAYSRGNKVFIKGAGKAVEFQAFTAKGKGIIGSKRSLEENLRTVANPLKPLRGGYVFTPEGLRVFDIEAQAARKLYGGFEFGTDKLGRVSSYRYSKDIPDYKAMIRALRTGKGAPGQAFDFSLFPGKRGMLNLPFAEFEIPAAGARPGRAPRPGRGGYYPRLTSDYMSFPLPGSGRIASDYGLAKRGRSSYLPIFMPGPSAYPPSAGRGQKAYLPVPSFPDIYTPMMPRPGRPTPPGRETPYPTLPNVPQVVPPFVPVFEPPGPPGKKRRARELDFSIDFGDIKKSRQSSKMVDFAPDYFPSVAAGFLNIRGRKPSKEQIGMGIAVRPIAL